MLFRRKVGKGRGGGQKEIVREASGDWASLVQWQCWLGEPPRQAPGWFDLLLDWLAAAPPTGQHPHPATQTLGNLPRPALPAPSAQVDDSLAAHNIHIRHFGGVPLADIVRWE